MKSENSKVIAALAALTLLSFSSCSEDNHVTNGIHDDPVRLHATVNAYTCYGGPNGPFVDVTGETATVVILRGGNIIAEVTISDSSAFDVELDTGTYVMAVRQSFLFPPDTTYDLHLSAGDTSLTLWTGLATLDPVALVIAFYNASPDDTLSMEQEWKIISELNQRTMIATGRPVTALDIEGTGPEDWERYVWSGNVDYHLNIRHEDAILGELYNVVEVSQLLNDLIASDTTGLVKTGMSVEPDSYIICFD